MNNTRPLLTLLLLVATSYGAYRFYLFPIRLGDDELAILQSATASLDEGVAARNKENHRIIKSMGEMIAKEGNRPKELLLLRKAEVIRDSTARMIALVDNLRKQWSIETGRVSLSDSAAKAFTASLNDYIKYLGIRSGLAFRPITHVPGARGAQGEFSDFYFRRTPVHIARYTLARLQLEVYNCEGRALDALARKVQHRPLTFERHTPMLSTESSVVEEGGMYRARLFMAHTPRSFDGRMTCNGRPIPVVNGIGQVRFKAEAEHFDKNGLSKQEWVGTVPVPPRYPFDDTVFTIRETYFVRKKNATSHE